MDSRLIRAALACALVIAFGTLAGPALAGTVSVSVPTWESDYDWSHGDGYAGWRSATTAADPAAYGFSAGLADLPGLWLWPAGGRQYTPGTAEWIFDAPGTTRIASATIDAAYAEKLFAHHCLSVSLDSHAERRASSGYCKPPQGGPKHVLFDVSDPASVPLSKEAHLTIEMPPCNNPADTPCSKYIPQLDPTVDGPFARGTHVHLVLVDDDQPAATASGPLRDGVAGYLNGHRAYDVTLSASDPGAGVRNLGLVGPGGSRVLSEDVTCDASHNTPELGSRLCPEATQVTRSVDLSNVPEGAAWYHADAQDLAANGREEDPWRVFVDRTAPAAPHDFDVDLDAETDTANVNWVADDDPALADGNPGSGLATWTYRFYHPRLGWSDWHSGTDSVEVPQSLEGDEIKVEVRSVDAVGNESDLASATLQIPVEDDEDSYNENLDDDQPEPADADVPDPVDAQATRVARSSADQTMTLQFQALSLSDRRDAALQRVRQDCVRGVAKVHCYDAVGDACHVGGICTAAKQIACGQAGLYCPVADAAKTSLIAQYQPTFRMDKSDRFWPVSFSIALKERWDGRSTCMRRDDDKLSCGYDDVRHAIRNMDHKVDGLKLDYPAAWDNTDDQFHSTTDALGLSRINTSWNNVDPRWDPVLKSARVYWYRGGGFGSNTGTAKSLQYWTFLTFNYLPTSGLGDQDHHEGDMEMVAVVLDKDNQPVWFFESRHGTSLKNEARRFLWGGGAFQRFDSHPIVFSAHGSHAMYESCGKHDRSHLPDDHLSCEDTDLLNFTYTDTKRISLGRSSWACWGGKLGNSGSTINGGGSPPDAPLYQEGTFLGDANPCADGSAASASAASAKRTARSAQDPVVEQFAHCDDWYQEPTQPGTTVVACDQAQLDHYIGSGLTDPGPGGAVVAGPDGRSNDVPSVYSTEDPRGLPAVRVTGSGSSAGVYAAALGVDGTLKTATFPATALPQGTQLHVVWDGTTAKLLSPAGRMIAVARVTTAHGSRFPVVAGPRGVKARRVGRRVVVSWRAKVQTSYSLSAGASRAAAGARLLKTQARGRAGRRRVVVRLRKAERWVGVRALKGSARSRIVAAKVP